jgi:hypothetical protein
MKIRSKVVNATIQNKDILNTFQELLGTSEDTSHLPVSHPKYIKMYNTTERFLKLLNMFKDSTAMSKFPTESEVLDNYIIYLQDSFKKSFNAPNLEQYLSSQEETLAGPNYKVIPDSIKKEFSITFHKCKKCNIVNIIIVTCKNLIANKKYFENKESISDIFLTKSSGNLFNPIPELSLNIKKMYNTKELTNNDRTFILMFIAKLYEISYALYEIISSPDIDVDDFVKIIVSSIDTVKKHIPRCDDAFNKIIESIDILKNNFDGYYKEFVASNNPSIIMENFVLDVSKNTKATPKITAQFRKIINHYRSLASKHVNDPRLQTLFKFVDKNFDELDKYKKSEDEYDTTDDNRDDNQNDTMDDNQDDNNIENKEFDQ